MTSVASSIALIRITDHLPKRSVACRQLQSRRPITKPRDKPDTVFSEATDVIRVNAYNRGLRAGYDFAATLSADVKKAYLRQIRKFGGIRVPKNWNRDAQISYVIDLAAAAVRSFLKRE